MTNKEFIDELASRTGYTAKVTRNLVDVVVDAMTTSFTESEELQIVGFGSFEVKKHDERIVINPQTKQRQLVPPKLVLNFRPAQTLKDKLKASEEPKAASKKATAKKPADKKTTRKATAKVKKGGSDA